MDGFRAAAILTILLGHSRAIAYGENSLPEAAQVFRTLIEGNTALFVFVTGFLTLHLAPGGVAPGPLWARKARNVLVPGAVWIGVLMACLVTFDRGWLDAGAGNAGPLQLLRLALDRSLTHSSLWYIPFVCLLYLVAPALLAVIRRGGTGHAMLFVATLVLGMTINRSPENADKLQNLGYFTFFFVFGACAARSLPDWIALCSKRAALWLSLCLAVMLAWLQVRLNFGIQHSGAPFASGALDMHYPQKIAQCVFFCALFLQSPSLVGGATRYIAKISFGLFFVHEIWLSVMRAAGVGPLTGHAWYGRYAIAFAVLLGLSVMTVAALSRMAGRHSRWIFGP